MALVNTGAILESVGIGRIKKLVRRRESGGPLLELLFENKQYGTYSYIKQENGVKKRFETLRNILVINPNGEVLLHDKTSKITRDIV